METIQVGDLIRISLNLRTDAEIDAGLRSPLVRVKEIRRDIENHVEVIVEQVDQEVRT